MIRSQKLIQNGKVKLNTLSLGLVSGPEVVAVSVAAVCHLMFGILRFSSGYTAKHSVKDEFIKMVTAANGC